MNCKACIHNEVCYATHTDESPTCCDFKDKSLFIELPCKVGDDIFKIDYCRCGKPENYDIKHCHRKETKKTPKVFASLMLQQKGKRINYGSTYLSGEPKFEYVPIGTICYKVIKKPFRSEWISEIGKTVFLTREEAEKALKEMEKDNG